MHDRFMAPIYPFAFAALTFAFLGAPRTTRQSRNFSMRTGLPSLLVFGLRIAGFACSVMADEVVLRSDRTVYDAGDGHRRQPVDIIGGIVIEPPAALTESINKSTARLLRLLGRPATA